MREILFRGKCKIDGGWVYGHFFHNRDNTEICIRAASEDFAVNPETVSQYTGLTDKNGTKIFEGDILKNEKGICFGGEYKACVEYSDVFGKYCAVSDCVGFEARDFEYLEVIGNIHDNPELLKGADKNAYN